MANMMAFAGKASAKIESAIRSSIPTHSEIAQSEGASQIVSENYVA